MSEYLPRVVDDELDELLESLPAIAIEGPKGVGKSVTAERRAGTVFRLDDPPQQEIARADAQILLTSAPPVLLDEWQYVPALWDAVRRAVDRDPSHGRFLLAGSAAQTESATHSGAGRIVTIRMRPLSLVERGVENATISLAEMLSGKGPSLSGTSGMGLSDYAHEIVISGFPALRRLNGRALRAQLDGYLTRIAEKEFVDQGYSARRPERLRSWMAAYAASTATTTSMEKVRAAATSGDGEVPGKHTVATYRTVLEQLWILDPVPGWLPSWNHLGRLTQAPKNHLADPALAARLLGVDEGALLHGATTSLATPRDGTLLGQLFESLATQSVRVYAQAAEARVRHLRTQNGRHEVDLIVERADGRIVAFEIKLGGSVTDDDVTHLLWLKAQLGADLLDMAVITTGEKAYRRADGVGVIPAALLGP